MKIVLYDKKCGELSINVSEYASKWFELTMQEYNEMFKAKYGYEPIILIAKERIMQDSEVYK